MVLRVLGNCQSHINALACLVTWDWDTLFQGWKGMKHIYKICLVFWLLLVKITCKEFIFQVVEELLPNSYKSKFKGLDSISPKRSLRCKVKFKWEMSSTSYLSRKIMHSNPYLNMII